MCSQLTTDESLDEWQDFFVFGKQVKLHIATGNKNVPKSQEVISFMTKPFCTILY